MIEEGAEETKDFIIDDEGCKFFTHSMTPAHG